MTITNVCRQSCSGIARYGHLVARHKHGKWSHAALNLAMPLINDAQAKISLKSS